MPIFAHIEFRCKRVEGVPDDVKAFLENKKFDAVVFLARRATSERKLQLYVAKTGSLIGNASTSKPDPHPCTPDGHEDFRFCTRLAPDVWSQLVPFLPFVCRSGADLPPSAEPTTRKECLGTLVKVLLDDIPPAASYEIGSAYSARGEGWKYEGEDFPAWWLRAPAEV
ncbi:hypothetical protein AAT19DRAFT_9757 [Rhodotorula toruloides]|uniref:FGENESH: predicted gene_11.59 protein n=1 Tax=Rhodotorula toruloides TaxID=5286 RepID=A0A0K3CLX2_RHOTO|nr:hypothetical protein AAT19DRAFT_9757 [Rhodotorula toruloides]